MAKIFHKLMFTLRITWRHKPAKITTNVSNNRFMEKPYFYNPGLKWPSQAYKNTKVYPATGTLKTPNIQTVR